MTDADRCVCCGAIIPEGYGRFWMRFKGTEGLLVFGICGRKISVGRNPDAIKDMNRSAPVFGVVCQSAAKARAIACAFTNLAEEIERRAEHEQTNMDDQGIEHLQNLQP